MVLYKNSQSMSDMQPSIAHYQLPQQTLHGINLLQHESYIAATLGPACASELVVLAWLYSSEASRHHLRHHRPREC